MQNPSRVNATPIVLPTFSLQQINFCDLYGVILQMVYQIPFPFPVQIKPKKYKGGIGAFLLLLLDHNVCMCKGFRVLDTFYSGQSIVPTLQR